MAKEGLDMRPVSTSPTGLTAFDGGAEGVRLSRKYSEMQRGNQSGNGDAVQRLRSR
jgi:hypothetical protein